MRNIWLVAEQEFKTYIRKRSFLFAVFGMPIMMAIILGIVYLVNVSATEQGILAETIGYINQSELEIVETEIFEDTPTFIAFSDEDSARSALEANDIDVYFVLPQSYLSNGNVPLYALGTVTFDTWGDIELFLVSNLTTGIETDAPSERLLNPVNFRMFLENNQREVNEEGIFGLLLVPIFFAVVLILAIQLSSGFLMSGVVEEKGNHIMEILITSITPYELLTGKLFGLGALGLLQVLVWLLVSLVGLSFAGNIEFLAGISLPFDFIITILLYFVLTYFMYGSILAGIGAVVGSEQESRTYAGMVSFFIGVPFFFLTFLIFDPETPIYKVLMFLPPTAGMSYLLRFPFSSIALWEIVLSLLILAFTTMFVTWASAKVFRWALLLYGKKPNLITIWRVMRGTTDIGTMPELSSKENSA